MKLIGTTNFLIGICFFLIILSACNDDKVAVPVNPSSATPVSSPLTIASPIVQATPVPSKETPVEKPKKQDYTLDILGNSNQLSNSSWNKMLEWRKQIVIFTKSHKDHVYLNGPDENMVALTFDDGPDAVHTPEIIDILQKYEVKGSFFFVGSNVKRYPEVVKKAYHNGNLVLGHSYNHDNLTSMDEKSIAADLQKTEEAISAVIGKKPAMARTPYGDTNDLIVNIYAKNHTSIILWSIDTLDWSQKESANISKNILSNVRNGDIILMHSSNQKDETVKALPRIIEELQKKKFQIVDLETLLQVKAYK